MSFAQVINHVLELIDLLLPVLVGAALLIFFFGMVKFISKAGDAASHEEGRSLMIWGVIGLFIMLSFMGIISLVSSDLGLGPSHILLPE